MYFDRASSRESLSLRELHPAGRDVWADDPPSLRVPSHPERSALRPERSEAQSREGTESKDLS
jgi:hypothetical protein